MRTEIKSNCVLKLPGQIKIPVRPHLSQFSIFHLPCIRIRVFRASEFPVFSLTAISPMAACRWHVKDILKQIFAQCLWYLGLCFFFFYRICPIGSTHSQGHWNRYVCCAFWADLGRRGVCVMRCVRRPEKPADYAADKQCAEGWAADEQWACD